MTRALRWVIAAAGLLLLAALLSYWGSRPQRVAALVASQVGSALGLEITARGAAEYTLAGGPRLVLRDVAARAPGATRDVLRAARVEVAVPWSTVRSRGAELTITRVELDAPVVDLAALQAWLASRPEEGERRTPTLTDGLRVREGRVVGDGWSVESIALDVPRVVAGQRVDARVSGRGRAGKAQFPFSLAVGLTQPANDAGLSLQGMLAYVEDKTRVPMHLKLSGPLHVGDDGVRIAPLRLSANVRYTVGSDTDVPFAFALNGPLRIQGARIALSPAGVALRGDGPVPDIDARAAFAYTKEAALHLDGRLAQWPEAWPALPPPIGQSDAPLPFVLDYSGPSDLSGIARLQLDREDVRFDGRFRLPELLAWVDAADASPLPPLTGTVAAPRVEVAGAVLEGVEVRVADPEVGAAP